MNKLYAQLSEGMSNSDIGASFGDTFIWDNRTDALAQLRDVGAGEIVLAEGKEYVTVGRDEFFSGRFQLFPPYEGMALVGAATYCVTRQPWRHYKKGMHHRHYEWTLVGDIRVRHPEFRKVAAALFKPEHLSLNDAWTRINSTELLSVPIGTWWAVAFSQLADGLAIYYKTTPVAKLLDSTTVEKVTNDPALLGMVRAEFPTLTWR